MTGQNNHYTITKRVAKHGKQSVIIIPNMLREHLKPGMLLEINLRILIEEIERRIN